MITNADQPGGRIYTSMWQPSSFVGYGIWADHLDFTQIDNYMDLCRSFSHMFSNATFCLAATSLHSSTFLSTGGICTSTQDKGNISLSLYLYLFRKLELSF